MVTGVKIQRSSKKGDRTLHQMRQRLLQLLSACRIYQRSHVSTLDKNQRIILELWEHVQECRDKACKRKHCRSSCLILTHYNNCKRSNKISTCVLCAPVERHLKRYCRGLNRVTNQNFAVHKMKHIDQYPIKDHGNDRPSIANRKTKISEEAQNSQITSTCLKGRTLPCKQYRKVVRWDKSVKGGNEQMIPLRHHKAQYMNKINWKVKMANEMWNLNHTAPSEKTLTRALVSDIKEASADSNILKEDKRNIVDASVILVKLKKSVASVECMGRVTQPILA